MAKKEKEIKTHLKGEDYWRWRCSILDMQKKEKEILIAELEHKLLVKDADMAMVRSQLFQKTKVSTAKDALAESKKEYETIKGQLEDYLGYSLNSKAIDDFTYEVLDLPQTTNSKES